MGSSPRCFDGGHCGDGGFCPDCPSVKDTGTDGPDCRLCWHFAPNKIQHLCLSETTCNGGDMHEPRIPVRIYARNHDVNAK